MLKPVPFYDVRKTIRIDKHRYLSLRRGLKGMLELYVHPRDSFEFLIKIELPFELPGPIGNPITES
jgi:hypothetical protein